MKPTNTLRRADASDRRLSVAAFAPPAVGGDRGCGGIAKARRILSTGGTIFSDLEDIGAISGIGGQEEPSFALPKIGRSPLQR